LLTFVILIVWSAIITEGVQSLNWLRKGGLKVAARVKMLDVDALVIDRNERIGDNWR
jgi:hypothetical protein